MARKNENLSAEKKEREVHVFIPEKLYSQAKLLAAVTDCSLAEIMRNSLKESLERKIARHLKELQDLISIVNDEE